MLSRSGGFRGFDSCLEGFGVLRFRGLEGFGFSGFRRWETHIPTRDVGLVVIADLLIGNLG